MRIIFTHSELERRWKSVKAARRTLGTLLMGLFLVAVAFLGFIGWDIYSGGISTNGDYQAVAKVISATDTGTAFFIGKGLMISAAHVVEDNQTVDLNFTSANFQCEATVLYTDSQLDLALLSVPDLPGISPVALGDSDLTSIGDSVLIVGYPLGEFSVTKGIVSNTTANLIQSDAAVNPGNSGGPIFTESNKEVIGIVVSQAMLTNEVPAEGTGYALGITRAIENLNNANYLSQ